MREVKNQNGRSQNPEREKSKFKVIHGMTSRLRRDAIPFSYPKPTEGLFRLRSTTFYGHFEHPPKADKHREVFLPFSSRSVLARTDYIMSFSIRHKAEVTSSFRKSRINIEGCRRVLGMVSQMGIHPFLSLCDRIHLFS